MDDVYKSFHASFCYCIVCGTPIVQAHHVTLRSQGGETTAANLLPLCPACHERRHNELLSITVRGGVATIIDKVAGTTTICPVVAQVATGPSELVDQARAVSSWLDLMIFGGRLRTESNEHLATLYDEMRSLKHRAWQVQAAIIAEMQARSSYGEDAIGHIAAAIGCNKRTAWRRAQIYREILSRPECASACENLRGEGWYQEALAADDPVSAIRYAEERKAGDPSYTCARFRAELRSHEESTLRKIVLVVADKNKADEEIAAALERRYKVAVELIQESSSKVGDSAPEGVLWTLPVAATA